MNHHISPMELTTLLNKTKQSISNLSLTEHRFLTFLLAFVNGKSIPTNGYLAWPGIDVIVEYTGLGDTTIQKIRKTLVTTSWITYTPGKGPGNSNRYYINAQKIIDCYVRSGNTVPVKVAAPTIVMEKENAKKHKRNTAGLVQNKVIVQEVLPMQQTIDKTAEPDKMDEGFRKRCYGVLCYSQEEFDRVKFEKELELFDADNPDCPF